MTFKKSQEKYLKKYFSKEGLNEGKRGLDNWQGQRGEVAR